MFKLGKLLDFTVYNKVSLPKKQIAGVCEICFQRIYIELKLVWW